MFANINEVYLFWGDLANKQQSGSGTPAQFNRWIDVGEQQYFKTKIGLPELYTVQQRQAPQEIQVTQVIADSLYPFQKTTQLNKVGNGFNLPPDFAALLPSGYLRVSREDGQTVVTNQNIDFVTSAEWRQREQDYITYPTIEYPIAKYSNGQIVVSPTSIGTITLEYYRYPTTPKRGYTVNSNDQDIYDPATSVQLEFPNLDWENICHIALKYYAEFLRSGDLYQIEQARIEKGM